MSHLRPSPPPLRSQTGRRAPCALALLLIAVALPTPDARAQPPRPSRLLTLQTPIGEATELVAFHGVEGLSRPFRYTLEMTALSGSIDPPTMLGRSLTFALRLADGSLRHFNGFVSRFEAGEVDPNDRRDYRAEIVPSLALLSRTTDHRIFQDRTIPEVVEAVLAELGVAPVELRLEAEYPPREFVVQYGESDLDFVQRLTEEAGIFYFFEQEPDRHTLVLSDSSSRLPRCSGCEALGYDPRPGNRIESLTSWTHRYEFRSGKVTLTDYNFETPSVDLTASATSDSRPDAARYEIYEYPGDYGTQEAGARLAEIRLQEEEVHSDVVTGSSTARGLAPGFTIGVAGHPEPQENRGFVVVSVEHEAQDAPPPRKGNDPGSGSDYSNRFTCIPDSTPFRPPRRTAKPRIAGAQTAVVVGPPGEEIHTDELGRVKVQFHWDREGENDENSSAWIRVAQPWSAGAGRELVVPRVGWEVLVTFEEGDPDRPIVVGRVFNAEDPELPPPPP